MAVLRASDCALWHATCRTILWSEAWENKLCKTSCNLAAASPTSSVVFYAENARIYVTFLSSLQTVRALNDTLTERHLAKCMVPESQCTTLRRLSRQTCSCDLPRRVHCRISLTFGLLGTTGKCLEPFCNQRARSLLPKLSLLAEAITQHMVKAACSAVHELKNQTA